MSLIQDALKRQQEEMNKKASSDAPATAPAGAPAAAPKAEAAPAAPAPKIPLRMMGQPAPAPAAPAAPAAKPAPAPAAPAPPPIPAVAVKADAAESPAIPNRNEPEHGTRGPAILIASFVILLLLLAGGLYWSWPSLFGKAAKPADVTMPTLAVADQQPEPATNQTAAVATPEQAGSPATTGKQAVAAAAVKPVATHPVSASDDASESLEASVNRTDKQALPPARVDAAPTLYTPPKTRPASVNAAPVVWPPIKLTGMVKLGGTAAALINGRVVAPGEEIENVMLVSISKDGAILRYKDDERLLRVGETAR